MPRLFALDKNFPQPIVSVLSDFQADATLVPLDHINPRMSTLDDWELLLALHHHSEPWDGLITTDISMLAQGPELATLIQTRLTLVVAVAAGHNPVKASGLLFAYLAGICQRTTPDRAQVWRLNAANRPSDGVAAVRIVYQGRVVTTGTVSHNLFIAGAPKPAMRMLPCEIAEVRKPTQCTKQELLARVRTATPLAVRWLGPTKATLRRFAPTPATCTMLKRQAGKSSPSWVYDRGGLADCLPGQISRPASRPPRGHLHAVGLISDEE